jgi:hypothetical protein
MHILPIFYGGIDDARIDRVVDSMLHFKRIGTKRGDDRTEANLYSHSKIVCVDRKLMYVGCDNAYPCYNEEHRVWTEDQGTINSWLDGVLEECWGVCKTPGDGGEVGKA